MRVSAASRGAGSACTAAAAAAAVLPRRSPARPRHVTARRRLPHSVAAGRAASGGADGASEATEGLSSDESRLVAPRMAHGLDVHRRSHALAGRSPAYLNQWRAFCERQGAQWDKACDDWDEALLAGARRDDGTRARPLRARHPRASSSDLQHCCSCTTPAEPRRRRAEGAAAAGSNAPAPRVQCSTCSWRPAWRVSSGTPPPVRSTSGLSAGSSPARQSSPERAVARGCATRPPGGEGASEGGAPARVPRSLHPTQGLPALKAVWQSACERAVGQPSLWERDALPL